MVNMLTPFPYTMTPMVNISPLSYRDAMTYAAELENIKQYLGTTLPTDLDTRLDEYLTSYQEGIANAEATVDAAKTEWDTRYDAFIANFTDQVKLLNEAAVAGMVPAGAVHDALLTLIDAEIAVATAANHTYTDTAVNGLRTETDADVARIDANVTGLQTLTADQGYMVATFLANGSDGEKLSLFYSPDGKTVTGTAGVDAYVPADGQGVRDPSLIRRGGKWFVAHTSNNGTDKDFAIASSVSGAPGTWTQIVTVSGAGLPDVSKIWAPELVVAPDGVYCFFTKIRASNTATGMMYWIKATNDQLTGWTEPAPMSWTAEPAHYIDGVPVLHTDGKWYFFYSTGNDIERAVATTITGTYTRDKSGNWAGWGTGIEGPYLTKEGDTYRIYFDRYAAGTGMAWSESTDLTTWTVPQGVKVQDGTLDGGQAIRHGSFYRITEPVAGRQAMAVQLGRVNTHVRHLEIHNAPGTTANKATVTTLKGWVTDTNETTDASIASYDPATGYITLNEFGVYAFTGNNSIQGVTGVNRSFADLTSVDGPTTTHVRTPGGQEDVYPLLVPNFKTNHAGERLQVRVYANWTGTETSGTNIMRLRITKIQ